MKNRVRNRVHQRGGLMIAAVVLIVVISFLGCVVTVVFVGYQ